MELYEQRQPRWKWRAIGCGALSVSMMIGYQVYLWGTQGSPLAFISTQQVEMGRSITIPGLAWMDGMAMILWGYGGFEGNWFMRVVGVQDWLALTLFTLCGIVLPFVVSRRSLIAYIWCMICFLHASHGPHSLGCFAMSRYVLAVFPGFIVIGWLMTRLTQATRTVVWALSGLLLCFLTGWFGNWGWVA
jgi:hypothetical protein